MMSRNKEDPIWLRIGGFLARIWRVFSTGRAGKAILVVMPGSLGDALLITGFLVELRRKFPGWRVKVVCNELCGALLDEGLHADAVEYGWPLSHSVKSPAARFRRICTAFRILRHRYEMVLHPVFSTNELAHRICNLAISSRKVWFDGDSATAGEGSRDSREIYTELVTVPSEQAEIQKLRRFLGAISGTTPEDIGELLPRVMISEEEKRHAREIMAEATIAGPDAIYLALCSGARFGIKDWGGHNFAGLLSILSRKTPVAVLALGAEEEREKFAEIGRRVASDTRLHFVNAAGRCSEKEAIEIIRLCNVCVGNDTFGLHAAIVAGTPSVVIMGGGDRGRWAPWGDTMRHKMVVHEMDCFGCRWQCRYDKPRCIVTITPEEVARVVEEVTMGTCDCGQ